MVKLRKHELAPLGLEFPNTLHEDKHKLAKAQVPIITISASFKKELTQTTGEKTNLGQEIVFSRAHYSMAVAILSQAAIAKKSAWLVDPINYISKKDWEKLKFMMQIGRLVARSKILMRLKSLIDRLARGKMPISQAVKEPLLYVTRLTQKPIISLHYEAGNLLADNGKKVLQVVTDPFVHDTYLFFAEKTNITFAVFDENTKKSFLEKAKKFAKEVDPNRIVVTGPPVDPRIIKGRFFKKKDTFKTRGLRLVFATSGLGTNKSEIKKILNQLFSKIQGTKTQVILYASTHQDFKDMFSEVAIKNKLRLDNKGREDQVRLIFHPSIVEANQDLIDNVFPWADGVITKPSGDMAYDAVGAGCFLLTLNPWGEWEENIESIFENLGISQKADINNFSTQLTELVNNGWIENAIESALNIDKLFLQGAKKIVDLQESPQLQ